MSTSASSFYITGGTVPPGTPSYVERQADKELFDALTRGEFCYVLTSRQMGKSSLMAHTTARLREGGITVANLDLTRLGQNLTVEQWYDGLLGHFGRQLDLEEELEEYWLAHERLSPLQRWLGALHAVVLARVPGPLVIAVDEIDTVRSLSFSTDEFFAAIRDCYNRRTQDPEFERLTFCLLGVATPSDLIQDTRTTPFNIGRRIELRDFSEAEAAPLARGLGRDSHTPPALLQRVLHWTGGHPYLSQRLCQAVSQDGAVADAASVDRLCGELFLSPSAREKDDNLLFVRERLLRSETDRASLLDFYGQVRSGKRITVDDTNPLTDLLRLSGVVRTLGSRLVVRNRIYERVFDRHWITQHMPDAELRRQRAAFLRGLLRATAVAAVVLAVMAGLAGLAMKQARRAEAQRRLAQAGQQTLRRHLYAARLNLAQQAWEEGNVRGAQDLLEGQRPRPGEEDLRGFEWRLLWRLCERGNSLFTFPEHAVWSASVSFSPDGRLLATGDVEGTVKLWDPVARHQIARLTGHRNSVNSVTFSPDGRTLASGSDDTTIRLWDLVHRTTILSLKGHTKWIAAVAFSPDGRTLASGSADSTVRLWDLPTHRQLAVLNADRQGVLAIAFSPDGRLLAEGGFDTTAKLWDVRTRRRIAVLQHQAWVQSVAFSPNGKLLATGTNDGNIQLWDVARRQKLALFRGHTGPVYSVAFSPDGRRIASASDDNTVKLWPVGAEGDFEAVDPETPRREITTLKGHRDHVNAVAFSPNGRILATGSSDHTVRLWSAIPRSDAEVLRAHEGWVNAVVFSSDGGRLVSAGGDGKLRLWNPSTGRPIASWTGHHLDIWCAALSPNGKLLASGSGTWHAPGGPGELKLWNAATHRELATLAREPHGVHALAFSPDGTLLAAETEGRSVKLWDVRSRRAVGTLKGHRDRIWCILFSPDGKLLATAGWEADGTVKLWDLAARKVILTIPGGFYAVQCLAFSPDGRTLAVASAAGGVKLWDVTRKRPAGTLREAAWPVVFSPDGTRVASNAPGDRIKLWDVSTREVVATLKGHTSFLQSLAFSPDGTVLASGSADGRVRLWRAATLPESDPLQLFAGGSDRAVTLQWRQALPQAYEVYRGPAGARPAQLVKLTRRPITGTSFTDHSLRLVNGRPQTYGVRAIYRAIGEAAVRGPMTTVQAAPVAAPPGYQGCSINAEPGRGSGGSVSFDPFTGEIAIRGSGLDIWDTADEFYFMSQPVTGEFTVSVRALNRPTGPNVYAKAGLMIRESLEPGARNAFLFTTPARGLIYQWRVAANEATDSIGVIQNPPPQDTVLRFPILLRLNRRGNTLAAEYSLDQGRRFRPAGEPLSLDPPLAPTVFVGLAICPREFNATSEAKFRDLRIEPQRP